MVATFIYLSGDDDEERQPVLSDVIERLEHDVARGDAIMRLYTQ
jgi:hypothetical protein